MDIQQRMSFERPYGGFDKFDGRGDRKRDHRGDRLALKLLLASKLGKSSEDAAAKPESLESPITINDKNADYTYNPESGEFDASGFVNWTNNKTGETHDLSMVADLQKGLGGTVTITKDGEVNEIIIPPRPVEPAV